MSKQTNKRNTQVNNFKIVLKITQGAGPRPDLGSCLLLRILYSFIPQCQDLRNKEIQEKMKNRETESLERGNLHNVLERLCPWYINLAMPTLSTIIPQTK